MLKIILLNWLYIIILMSLVWLIYYWQKNASIIDVFWPISIAFTGLHYSFYQPINSPTLLFQLALIIWALRLAFYLFITRIIPKQKDKRYEAVSQAWTLSKNIGFFFNFQFQGLLAIIMASPFLFIAKLQAISLLNSVALILFIIGLTGEVLADYQLHYFKKNKCGRVCNIGLWQYSRHPNYFFEWLIWLSFFLAAITLPWGWLSVISPLLLLFLMLKITIPITERASLKSRGELYQHYQQQTSLFILWPKKKRN